MKTGMEWPLLGLVVLVVLVFLWATWSNMQVDLAVAAVTASAAGASVPAPVMIGGQWIVNALVGTLIGAAVTAGGAALVIWAKKQLRQSDQGKWRAGPNANWGQQARPPKVPSEAELYRLMLMRQMVGPAPGAQPVMRPAWEDDDEPTIHL